MQHFEFVCEYFNEGVYDPELIKMSVILAELIAITFLSIVLYQQHAVFTLLHFEQFQLFLYFLMVRIDLMDYVVEQLLSKH